MKGQNSKTIKFTEVMKFIIEVETKAKEIHRCMAELYDGRSKKYSYYFWIDSLEDDKRPG